ncbi:hypothetical protein LTR85_011082 [Meristemomyces frigidus]|nr:hypothetical protein LTR85_011082 [Meristemomyces frigidus]
MADIQTDPAAPTCAHCNKTRGPDNQLWGGEDSFLHGKPETEVYSLLIDSYRLHTEDEYSFRGDAGGLYAGEDPVKDFRKFLRKAERKEGVLPPWWNAEKKDACVKYGNVKGAAWGSLHGAVEKSDIQEHYKNPYDADAAAHAGRGDPGKQRHELVLGRILPDALAVYAISATPAQRMPALASWDDHMRQAPDLSHCARYDLGGSVTH